jgi:hypothetical protein
MASLPTIVTYPRGQIAPLPPRELIRTGRTRSHAPCPICGRDDGQCIALPLDGRLQVWCIRGGGRPDGVRLAWGFRGQIWYFALDAATGSAVPLRLLQRPREWPLADAGTMHRILSRVARSFGLSDSHRALLAAWGYEPDTCGPEGRHVFASLPADATARVAVANRLLSDAYTRTTEEDLLGVYGFERISRSPRADVAFLPRVAGAALLEFARDEQGRLIGFQYAPDAPMLDNKGKPRKRLSPARFATGGRAHVARTTTDAGTACWHTEAIHKANLTTDRVQAPALGSFGVGNVAGLVAGARAVDPHRKRLHILSLDADHHGSREEVALARRLQEQGYRVALARWDAARGNGPDDALVAGAAVTLVPFADPRPQPRQDRRILHTHAWQRKRETPQEREALLRAEAERLAARVKAHLESTDPAERSTLLVVAAPPGVGKSHAVAALGEPTTAHPLGELNLAWIAERRDMVQQIPALSTYRQIEPCNPKNCSADDLHTLVASSGHNTWGVHSQHLALCDYAAQFRAKGSAVYQLAHVPTGYPAQHDGIVIDECNPSAWLPEQEFTVRKLQAATAAVPTGSVADLLLRAVQATLTDAAQARTSLTGRALFEALDVRCGRQLAANLGALCQHPEVTDPHPWPGGLDITDPNAAQVAAALPPVVLPQLWRALAGEMSRWQAGVDWNSRLRIGPVGSSSEMALFLTEPRHFGAPAKGALPPQALLDGTGDAELLALLFETPVTMLSAEVAPPPNIRHIAVRTGKRYGKTSLTARHGRDLVRAIAECRYLLRELDPDGALVESSQVGLITHKDCERPMAEALGIPEHRTGHFWGMRGSNRLEECTLLLVVGTPAVRPEQVARLARAYYHADPQVIDEMSERGEDGTWRYRDLRMQRVANALVRAELTQCAHRSRPLRYNGRVVVTLCADEVLYLPVTTEITSLPQLTPDGLPLALARRAAEHARMARAATDLAEHGEAVTSRALAEAAHISLNTACTWLRQRETGTRAFGPMLSVLQYSSYSTADNIPAVENSEGLELPKHAPASVDPPEAPTSAPEDVPLLSEQPAVCLAASHRLLWRWTAGAWQCPLCADHALQYCSLPSWGG